MSVQRRPARSIAALAVAFGLVLGLAGPAHADWGDWGKEPADSDDTGNAHVVAEQRVDSRTLDLTIASPATGEQPKVRLLLPPEWSPDANRTWPVLYLLHGCCDSYEGWDKKTDVRELSQGQDVIVAMPAGGPSGFFADWWNSGNGGMDWGRFTVEELPQILESGYRANDTRAIAGASTGGHAALIHAARYSDRYQAAAAYSPIANTLAWGLPWVIQALLEREGASSQALWGHPYLNRNIWHRYNPYDHTDELQGTELFLSVGNGEDGPLDPPNPDGGLLESTVAPTVHDMADRLEQSGIPATTHFYGPGTHSWPYWERELHHSWPMLMESLGVPTG